MNFQWKMFVYGALIVFGALIGFGISTLIRAFFAV